MFSVLYFLDIWMTIVGQFEANIFLHSTTIWPSTWHIDILKSLNSFSVCLDWNEYQSLHFILWCRVFESCPVTDSPPLHRLFSAPWLDLGAKHVPPPRTTLQLEHNRVSTLSMMGLLGLQCVHHQRNNHHISMHNSWGQNQNIRVDLRNWVQ